MPDKTVLDVVCAVIIENKRVLAVKRSPKQSNPGLWEFPGGKVKPFESDKEALRREIEEELSLDIVVHMTLPAIWWNENPKYINLKPYICEIRSGEITLNEHEAFRWLHPTEMSDVEWSPADIPLADYVAQIIFQF